MTNSLTKTFHSDGGGRSMACRGSRCRDGSAALGAASRLGGGRTRSLDRGHGVFARFAASAPLNGQPRNRQHRKQHAKGPNVYHPIGM